MRKFIYVEYLDHWENKNIRLTDAEIRKKLEYPIVLNSFGIIRYEDDRYLVIENFSPQKVHFILKSAIISQKIFVETKKEIYKLI
ncbi:MAG: hypothetical protein ACTSQ8_07735 [Candidatus Helarchaeota archaeon]